MCVHNNTLSHEVQYDTKLTRQGLAYLPQEPYTHACVHELYVSFTDTTSYIPVCVYYTYFIFCDVGKTSSLHNHHRKGIHSDNNPGITCMVNTPTLIPYAGCTQHKPHAPVILRRL